MKPRFIPIILCSLALASSPLSAAQPDYPTAIWRSAYPGHWYTTGVTHAFVVEHDMEGYYWATISYFQQAGTQASINYCVNGLQNGSDSQGHSENNPSDSPPGEITQMVEEQFWAWHVLCWNRYMFGTEHEGFVTSPVWYSDAMYQASGALTRYLCDKYGIPKDRNHIIGHNEWQNPAWRTWMTNNWPQIDSSCNNHTDPGQYWDWNKFMSIVGAGGGTPSISVQPWSRLVEPGSNVTFSASVSSSTGVSFQWLKNGTKISSATSTNFSITSVQPSDAAGYSIVASNSFGSVTSRVATLTVSPAWVPWFSDNLDSDTSTNWNFFWGAANGIPDYTVNWAFDYSTNTYIANGGTNLIPVAPSSSGTRRGLKVSVNKNDTNAATVGVSFYPRNLLLSNDYVLRFDLWLNYNGGPGGGTGSTEYATLGLNHTGTEVNWTTSAPSSDGLWFGLDGEGGSAGGDYRAYLGNGAAPPTLRDFTSSGIAASGAASDDNGDQFFNSLFPSPTYETSGAPGKHWVQCELSQIGNLITWQMNGVVVAQRTNSSAFTGGTVMLGYMDPYPSIANPAADNFAIFDNVRVLVSAASAAMYNLAIFPRPNSALIKWSSLPATTAQLEYGIAPNYDSITPIEPSARTSHALLLTGLVRNTNYVFRIHSHVGTNEYVSGQFTFSTSLDFIVDNPDATYSGNWVSGFSSPDEYGSYFEYAVGTTGPSPSAQATYTPTLPIAAKYDVFIWYPQGSNRATNTPVTIFHNGGYVSSAVDQTSNGGGWRLLASALDLPAGSAGFASIGNNTGDTNSIVAADAMRWSYAVSQDIPSDGSVPSWWSSYYFGSNIDGSLDHDHDGYSAYKEYVMGTDPTDASSHFSFSQSRSGTNLLLTFSPWVSGRTYELQTSSNLSAVSWTPLPDSPAVTNGVGAFLLSNISSPGAHFYRVAVRLTP